MSLSRPTYRRTKRRVPWPCLHFAITGAVVALAAAAFFASRARSRSRLFFLALALSPPRLCPIGLTPWAVRCVPKGNSAYPRSKQTANNLQAFTRFSATGPAPPGSRRPASLTCWRLRTKPCAKRRPLESSPAASVSKSSPSRIRTYNKPVNSRLLYR